MTSIGERVRRFLQKPGTADLSRFQRLLPAIAAREEAMTSLTDAELAGLLASAKDQKDQAERGAALREAASRALGERPYDAQLLGTLAMLSGCVAELATGEGKTLSGALAAAAYAASGRRVHVMSVNDYLARRDAEWMRPVYDLLGITAGHVGQASTRQERREAYAAQVTYAPVSEIGFDLLKDRLRTQAGDRVMPDPDVVLIDEADSVLIDEARVPIVLAGAAEAGDAGRQMAGLVAGLRPGLHYQVDFDGRSVHLTDAGTRAAEHALGDIDLYGAAELDTLTRLNVALHAHALLHRDIDYIVRDGRIQLINTSRGRIALLQRWPDGLQAAVEAKEAIPASASGEVLDSITVESLVRRYPRICGMTATAVPVGAELREFYGLEVAVIAPNRPCVRDDEPDRIYATVAEKEAAVAVEVVDAHDTGRPVLIGTLDVAESERLASRLAGQGLRCTVLNAKNDSEEAAIIAEAGSRGAITVSTQMAGRGTDIRLGGREGDDGATAGLGGLRVIGTGRYWSPRLDNQLRGRAGRQGDPGSSVFFVSMEDELITAHAPDAEVPREVAADGLVGDAKARWTVGHAQRVAEGANTEIHRNTWRYNKLIEEQRRVLLEHRERVLATGAALTALARHNQERYDELAAEVDLDVLEQAARDIVLCHLDRAWAGHLAVLANIREGIHLRALGHGPNPFIMALDPLAEFHAEAVKLFKGMLERIEQDAAGTFATAEITSEGIDASAAGLKRPSATWTYLVKDNPFGTDADRALRRLVRKANPDQGSR
ncbi:MAG TPA: accessory Sec system translocase SecA2 [Streptosporangiaceae bacterium]|nr:accessory Sec system translocase SecA2 [Streptosporangiaceae bacterium]